MRKLSALALWLVVSALACLGQATPQWTRITQPNDTTTNEVSFVRTRDSQLQVAWRQQTPQDVQLVHQVIDANGNLAGEPKTIVSAWSTLNAPALLLDKDGTLRALFSGVRNPQEEGPFNSGSLYSARNNYGGSWRLLPGLLSASTNAYSGDTAATIGGQGSFIAAWSGSVQNDPSPTAAPLQLQSTCCAYTPGLATDGATGEVVVAWYSNANPDMGLFAQTVSPSVGQKIAVPGSVTTYEGKRYSVPPDQHVPISGRIGEAGIYVAFCEGYPTAKRVDLWQLGRPAPGAIANVRGGCHAYVTAGPQGRLWVVWSDQDRILATRSNRSVTRFGNPVAIMPPAGWHTTYRLKAEGSAGPLDVFAHMDVGSGASTWYARMLPGLTVSADPLPATGGKVTLSVTDAGDPVSGAVIHIGPQTLTTNARGEASTTLPKGDSYPVSVTATGYADAGVMIVSLPQ